MAFNTQLLVAQTSGTSRPVPLSGSRDVTVYVRGSAGVSAGAVTIEEAEDENASSWAAVGSAVTVPANAVTPVHLSAGAYQFLRARISTPVTGGNCTVSLVANQA